MILVIDRKATTVLHDKGSLIIERRDKPKQRIPVRMLMQVIIHGNPLIEASVWRALAEAEVTATILPIRGTGAAAVLARGLATRLPLRCLQHRVAADDTASLVIARWFIERKLAAYILPLSLIPSDFDAEIQRFGEQCRRATAALNEAPDIATVMGIEGAVANAWFQLLATVLPAEWAFKGRNRRPPRDPLNALLSLGYTLLASEIYQVLLSEGLDPSLGFLHQAQAGRQGLVLDVQEVFRAGIDLFALDMLASLTPADFTSNDSDGCRLSKGARRTFYEAWAEYRENWPRQQSVQEERLRFATLAEQVRGVVMDLRAQMKSSMGADTDGGIA